MALPGRTRRDTYSQSEETTQETGGEAKAPESTWKKHDRPAGGKFFKFQNVEDSIEGTFKSFFESEYEGKTSVNATLLVGKQEISFRLTMQLEQYFSDVKPGDAVKVVYKGKIGKMKNFDFFTEQK
jgi:hypothetical protein